MNSIKVILLLYVSAFPLLAKNELLLAPAYQKCLTGRCKMGECPVNKMPHYSLGHGYICDRRRSLVYKECRKTSSIDSCLAKADQEREKCKETPCPYVYENCLLDRCTKDTDSWSCWKREGSDLVFGYTTMDENGAFYFKKVEGKEVSQSEWAVHCIDEKDRCEKIEKAKPAESVLPIAKNFCSAKCYGHNCHHAVTDVCVCLKKEGLTHIGVLVTDKDKLSTEIPKGNVNHSLLVIPHPDKKKANRGVRCLLEAQGCEPNPLDPNCCYANEKELRDLETTQCKLLRTGPLKRVTSLKDATLYSKCETFLEERGTLQPEVLPWDKIIVGPKKEHIKEKNKK